MPPFCFLIRMKKLFYISLLSVFFRIVPCEAQTMYFNNLYGYRDTTWDSFEAIDITNDSGYIAVGFSTEYFGPFNLYIIRADKAGNKLWQQRLEFDSVECSASSVISLPDNTYMVAGSYWIYEYDASSGNNVRTNRFGYLLRYDSNGDTLWTKKYGTVTGTVTNPDYEGFRKIIKTAEGGFAMAGYTGYNNGYGIGMYLVKTDSVGNKQWEKIYGGSKNDEAFDILQMPDGGYFLFGLTDSYASYRQWYLVRTDILGNKLWEKTYGLNDYNVGTGMALTIDNKLLLTGGMYITSTDCQAVLMKVDTLGNTIWEKRYGGSKGEGFSKVITLLNGTFVGGGASSSYSADGYDDGWIAKFDTSGNMIWNRIYNRSTNPLFKIDDIFDLKATSDGGFIFCGSSGADSPDFQEAWLLKTDCLGCDSLLCYYPDSVCIDTTVGINELFS